VYESNTLALAVDIVRGVRTAFVKDTLYRLRSRIVLVQFIPDLQKRVNIVNLFIHHSSTVQIHGSLSPEKKPLHLFGGTQEEARSPCKTQVP
jgi:hypothetical protein